MCLVRSFFFKCETNLRFFSRHRLFYSEMWRLFVSRGYFSSLLRTPCHRLDYVAHLGDSPRDVFHRKLASPSLLFLFLLATPTTLEAHSLRPRRTIEIGTDFWFQIFINQTIKPI